MVIKKLFCLVLGIVLFPSFVFSKSSEVVEEVAPDSEYTDSVADTAPEAFLLMNDKTLDLIPYSMRLDMLDYLKADTVPMLPNTLGGMSYLVRPVTDNFLRLNVTSVSQMTFKILPFKKRNIVAVTYTISDKGHPGDSEIAFYDDHMSKLKTNKFIKLAQLEDFLQLPDDKKSIKNELMALVPFPTIEYTLSPDNNYLTAALTIKQYMGVEDYQRLEPYLKSHLTYIWNGRKFELLKK